MSDTSVRAAIEQMEAWLADANWIPNVEVLAQWDAEFQASLARAEKGPGWVDLVARAMAAGRQVEDRTVLFVELRDQLRKEIEAHERGSRALKGYEANSR